jgi:hypothetical protein
VFAPPDPNPDPLAYNWEVYNVSQDPTQAHDLVGGGRGRRRRRLVVMVM